MDAKMFNWMNFVQMDENMFKWVIFLKFQETLKWGAEIRIL